MANDIEGDLLARLAPIAAMPVLNGQGVYVLSLRDGAELSGIEPGNRGVLYVGMTEDSLSVRNHYLHRHSGGSTLRRSLGAVLRGTLGLCPVARDSKPANADKYRFADEDELRLSAWMEANLLGAQVEVDEAVRQQETALIASLKPPLNLTKWRNPQKPFVSAARAACRDIVAASFRRS